jgi:hypothetical protein
MLLKLWTNSYLRVSDLKLRCSLRMNEWSWLLDSLRMWPMWQLPMKSRWTDLMRPCNTIKYIKIIRNAIKTMNKFIRQTQTQSYSCAACEWNEVDNLTHLGCDLQYNTIYQKHKKCLYNYKQIHISYVSYSGAACSSYKWNEVDSLRNRMWQFQYKMLDKLNKSLQYN